MDTVNKTVEQIVFEGVDKLTAISKSSQSAVKDLRNAINSVQNALAGIGVTVGAGALINLYHDALKATAALNDMAQQTGASVEGLSAIQNVARVGGRDFDGFVGQMGRMIKGLKDADDEGQKAAYALNYLGIKAKDLQGHFRDPAQIVEELAVKLSKYGDSGNKVALVQDALGKGAERYLPLLEDIAKKTDYHASTTKAQAAAAEEAEKNINRLKLQMELARRELVNDLTPSIIEYSKQVTAAKEATGGWIAALALVGTTRTSGDVRDLSKRIEEINAELENYEKRRQPGSLLKSGSLLDRLGFGGGNEGRRAQERAFLERLRAERLRALGEGLYEDAAGNVGPAPAKASMQLDYQSLDPRRLKPSEIAKMQIEALDELKKQESEYTVYVSKQELERRDIRLKAIHEQVDQESMVQRARIYGTTDEDPANQDPERAARTDRLQAIRESFKSQEDLARESYNTQLATVREFSDQELEAIGGRLDAEARLRARYNYDVLVSDRQRHAASRQMEIDTVQLFAGLMQQLGAKSRAAALLAIALNKGLAAAQVIVNTQAAVARGYAELGPIAGTANAARMEALMGIQLGIIAATGLVEASQSGRGGGASSPSTGGGAGSAAVTPVVTQAQAPQRNQTTIIEFNGTTDERRLLRRFVDLLNENGGDGMRILMRGA